MVLSDTTPDLTSCKLLNTNSKNSSKFNVYLNGTENGSNQTEHTIKCHENEKSYS